jgi:hypothetical protein
MEELHRRRRPSNFQILETQLDFGLVHFASTKLNPCSSYSSIDCGTYQFKRGFSTLSRTIKSYFHATYYSIS